MIKIKNQPIICHIIKSYEKYGFKNFIIALGYKGIFIKNFFKNKKKNLNIKLINTGLKTMTGGRLKRLKKFIGNETFLLTYGDGVSNVNLKKLIFFIEKIKILLL